MTFAYRHKTSFTKRIEHWIVGQMLKQGLDVFMPLVDDAAADVVIRRPDGSLVEVQIKALSKKVKFGEGARFTALTYELRYNYWFVFYSERLNTIWALSSEEFVAEAVLNKTGSDAGKRSIWLNGTRKIAGTKEEYAKERYEKYVCNDFSRLLAPATLKNPFDLKISKKSAKSRRIK